MIDLLYKYIHLCETINLLQELEKRRAAMAEPVEPSDPSPGEMPTGPTLPNSQPIFGKKDGEADGDTPGVTTSTTTPGKIVKKARVEPEGPTPKALFNSPAAPDSGATGGTDPAEDVMILRALNKQLESDKHDLEKQVADLSEKLKTLSLTSTTAAPDGDNVDTEGGAPPASDDAARKRLARICARNSQGKHGCKMYRDANVTQ